ncbi:hypothetical protein KL86DYS1_30231 [uncultured Dysgonomonas sp.]|uniref:Uncharacterized protein n=1 Tax=uncultured Dysgonomonas sp. TaxID=206096 RepID=A0A212JRX9_9BACT|nr:hypothetical protein KL86DYS1_30231 [uncultured Dysgonomonas sp.]
MSDMSGFNEIWLINVNMIMGWNLRLSSRTLFIVSFVTFSKFQQG